MIRVNTLFKYVSYHPMEHQILTTGTDRKVGYWETFDGSMIRELDGSLSGSVNALDISTDGTYFVSGGDDKLIKVCDNVIALYLTVTWRDLAHAIARLLKTVAGYRFDASSNLESGVSVKTPR